MLVSTWGRGALVAPGRAEQALAVHLVRQHPVERLVMVDLHLLCPLPAPLALAVPAEDDAPVQQLGQVMLATGVLLGGLAGRRAGPTGSDAVCGTPPAARSLFSGAEVSRRILEPKVGDVTQEGRAGDMQVGMRACTHSKKPRRRQLSRLCEALACPTVNSMPSLDACVSRNLSRSCSSRV